MESIDYRTEFWQPSQRVLILWTILGFVPLPLFGIILFALVYTANHSGEAGGIIGGSAILLTLLLTVVLVIPHEWLHGLAMKRYGAQPKYGAGTFSKVFPYFYCTAPGNKFTKSQFAVIGAAPVVVISLVGALCVAFLPLGGWLVAPLGFHFGCCVGDLWFLGLLARQPKGTLLEDLETGVRIHRPAARVMLDSRP